MSGLRLGVRTRQLPAGKSVHFRRIPPGGPVKIEVRDLVELVEAFVPDDDRAARANRDRTLSLLRTAAWPLDRRAFATGHVTTSGLVLSPDGERVLLVFHPRLRRWLQPGGHLEASDSDIATAARREVREETGVGLDDGADPVLVGIDVHDIPATPAEPRHVHHDLVFAFLARDDESESVEALRAAWCHWNRLDDFTADPPLRRAAHRARAALRPAAAAR
jgi:8-oxo-dGTP pyrophosphatase MutT (NUDIX family)